MLQTVISQFMKHDELSKDVSRFPPALAARYQEYQRAALAGLSVPLFRAAENYSVEFGFHKEVVTKIFDPATRAAYWTTPRGKRLAAPRQGPEPLFPDDYQKRAEAPLAPLRAALVQEQATAAVAGDLEAAKAHNVSMSFFGLSLGQPLNLPNCEGTVWEQSAKGTCRMKDAIPLPLHVKWVRDDAFASPLGMTNVTVRLGAARCPDWIECVVVLTVRGDVPLAAQILTNSNYDNADESVRAKILSKLTDKYGSPTEQDSTSQCNFTYDGVALKVTGEAKNYKWKLAGLTVAYVPYGGDSGCKEGAIRIEAARFGQLREQAKKRHDAAQPDM